VPKLTEALSVMSLATTVGIQCIVELTSAGGVTVFSVTQQKVDK